MALNKHGLSRTIPPAVKQSVRKRCGFGCVVCGSSIIQYHHFNPEYFDAKQHLANGITLLCGTHHQEAHAGIISRCQLEGYDTRPYSMIARYSWGILRPANKFLPVQIGSCTIISPEIVRYDDDTVIGLIKSNDWEIPILLNATFTDSNGKVTLSIVENEWQIGSDNFDVEITKDELTIKSDKNEILLRMKLSAQNSIVIETLKMNYKGFKIEACNGSFSVTALNGATLVHYGANIGDIGIWLKSSGHALLAAGYSGGAGVRVG